MTRTPVFTRRVVFVLLGLVPLATAFGIVNDSDLDGIVDSDDNCIGIANADQRDSNADGIGNACDGDFDGSCSVSFEDLGIMKAAFFLSGASDTDMNGDGQTNFADLGSLKRGFFLEPGPSGVVNECGLGFVTYSVDTQPIYFEKCGPATRSSAPATTTSGRRITTHSIPRSIRTAQAERRPVHDRADSQRRHARRRRLHRRPGSGFGQPGLPDAGRAGPGPGWIDSGLPE